MEEADTDGPMDKTKKVKRARNYNWTDAEVRALMKAWWDHHKDYTTSKGGCSRRPLYDKISFDIRRYGYQRTRAEAQTKLQNLLKIFRKERETLRQTGEKYSKWRYYNLVKRIVDAEPPEIGDSFQDYLSSDQDSRENGVEMSSPSAHIIKLSSSVSGNASDSDNPSSSHMNMDSQDVTESGVYSFIGQSKRRKNIEDILAGLLEEFQRANSVIERNDEELMSLLRENNELFKQQNELLTLLLNK